jgi:hypothetical protein
VSYSYEGRRIELITLSGKNGILEEVYVPYNYYDTLARRLFWRQLSAIP